MKPRLIAAVLVLLLASSSALVAQIEDQPGYFPIDQFDILSSDSISLEINLGSALLGLVAAALETEEPELAGLIRGLKGIRVRVAEADDLDVEGIRSGLSEATDWLADNDWSPMLRLREDDEEVYVYSRITDGVMHGMTLLAVESGGEAVLVNIVGTLDAASLAGLAKVLDIPQLGLAAGGLNSRDDDDGDEDEENDQ
jgi:hypothetical protein